MARMHQTDSPSPVGTGRGRLVDAIDIILVL
jgi:hypothetical protein